MIIAVTGASGYIGQHLCKALRARGHQVRALVSAASLEKRELAGFDRFLCDLPDRIDESGLAGAEAIVHLAYATKAISRRDATRTNEEGTRRLLSLARRHDVFFVFVSSVSAHREGPSDYSRSKYDLEQAMDASVDAVVRPGLVMHPGQDGLFGRMEAMLRSVPIVPCFGKGRQPIYTVSMDDMLPAIATILERRRPGLFMAAHPTPTPYADFYRAIARRLGKRVMLVPLPLWPTVPLLRGLEKAGLRLPITSENVRGVEAMRPVTIGNDWEEVGIRPASFEESLDRVFGT